MPIQRCRHISQAFYDDYTRLVFWLREYKDSLDLLSQDHVLLCADELHPPASVLLAIDSFDVIGFCFPFDLSIDGLKHVMKDAEFRKLVFEKQVSRACIFYGLPSQNPVLLLPPHYDEVIAFINRIRETKDIVRARQGLLQLVLPRLEPFRDAIKSLPSAITATEGLEETALDLLATVAQDFEEVALLLIGVYTDGLEQLHDLLASDSLVEDLESIAKSDFFTRRNDLLDEVFKQTSTGRAYANAAELQSWYQAFQKRRPNFVEININDAKAIQLILDGNAEPTFTGQNMAFLLVSSVDSLKNVVSKHETESTFIAPHGQELLLFRPLRVFYYLLQHLGTKPDEELASELTKSRLMEIHRSTLQNLCSELEKVEDLLDTADAFERLLMNCPIESSSSMGTPTPDCITDCPLREEGYRNQIQDVLCALREVEERAQDARVLRKRHHFLEPYLAKAGAEPIAERLQERIKELVKYLQRGADWTELLDHYITDLENTRLVDAIRLRADVTSSVGEVPDILLDTLFAFPYFIAFQSQPVRDAVQEIANLARKRAPPPSPSEIGNALTNFRLAASDPQIQQAELDLIRAAVLCAFQEWQKAITLVRKALASRTPFNKDFRYLEIRSHARLYDQTKSTVDLKTTYDKAALALHESPDARVRSLFALIKSIIHVQGVELEGIPVPSVEEVCSTYELALQEASSLPETVAVAKDFYKANIINNWCYFLAQAGVSYVDKGFDVLQRMPIDRSQWYATWLHTEGVLYLVRAQDEDRSIENRLRDVISALESFDSGLETACSQAHQRQLRKDAETAEALRAVLTNRSGSG